MCTDVSNASRTLLFNIETLDWDDDLLRDPARAAGDAARGARLERGPAPRPMLSSSAPRSRLPGIAGDQQAALFGQACFATGQAKNTYGTGCFLLVNTGADAAALRDGPADDRWPGVSARETTYALEGSAFVTGAAVQWLRDGLGHHLRRRRDRGPRRSRCPTTAACTWCPRSSGWARRTGTCTRAVCSSG